VLLRNSSITIAEAREPADRERVYGFRYQIYVEEMRRFQQYADHNKKRICEPQDLSGHVLWAYDIDSKVIGTVRYNVGMDENFGIYTELYGLESFAPFFPRHVSITTKLMVSAKYRLGGLACQLARACCIGALELGVCFDFIDCNPPLVRFFEHLGYREIAKSVLHPEYGVVVPMVLAVHDVVHLENVGSPFAALSKRFKDERHSVEFIRDLTDPSGRVLSPPTRSSSGDLGGNEQWASQERHLKV
jgi:hypothetical protein